MMIWFSIFGSILLVSLISGLPTSDDKPIICNRKGRLSNPKNCGSFFECMEDDYSRSLLSFERFCPSGMSFLSSSGGCGKALNVQGCNLRRGKHLNSNPQYDYICKDSNVSYVCVDCQTQITCTEGHAYVTKCVNKMRCVANSPDFDGGVCHTHFDDQCRCTSPSTYRRDPFSNSTYFSCEAKNAAPIYYNCQQGMYFDEVTKTCVSNDGTPACTANGLFTFPKNCAKYYNCTSDVEGWDQKIIFCPDKQLFNQETGMCEDPCNWELKEFQCKTQGRFQNPKDCQRFTECVNGDNGELLAMERQCPPGFHFNETNKKCVARILSSCEPQKEGPLQQCTKEFLAICITKLETIPEIISETVSIEENDGKEPERDITTEEAEEAEKRPEQNPAKGEPIDGAQEAEKRPEQNPAKGEPIDGAQEAEKRPEQNPANEEPIDGAQEAEKRPEQNPAKGEPIDGDQEGEKRPEQNPANGEPIDGAQEAEKRPEQNPAKGEPIDGAPVGEISVEETPMEEKTNTGKQTEGNPVEEKLVEETPMEEKPNTGSLYGC